MDVLSSCTNAQVMEASGGPLVTRAFSVMAGLLLLTGLLGTTVASTAYAQDKSVKRAPASVHVPMVDARASDVRAVHFVAVAQSDKSIVVVFYGQDRNLFNDAKEATRESIANGIPVRGMIFGPPTSESNIEVYANGLLASPKDMKWDKDAIRETLEFANTEYIQSGRFDIPAR